MGEWREQKASGNNPEFQGEKGILPKSTFKPAGKKMVLNASKRSVQTKSKTGQKGERGGSDKGKVRLGS